MPPKTKKDDNSGAAFKRRIHEELPSVDDEEEPEAPESEEEEEEEEEEADE